VIKRDFSQLGSCAEFHYHILAPVLTSSVVENYTAKNECSRLYNLPSQNNQFNLQSCAYRLVVVRPAMKECVVVIR